MNPNIYSAFTTHTYIIVLVWTCLMILQMYVIKIYIENWRSRVVGTKTEHMQWNIENKNKLNKAFSKEIEKRLTMLENMTYSDWIDYNNKHATIVVGKYVYDFFIFERVKNDHANYGVKNQYLLRANKVHELLGLPYTELLKQANYTFLFTIFSPNPDFLNNIYLSEHYASGVNVYAYYTVDNNVNRPVKSNVIGGKFTKVQDDNIFSGVMYIAYSLLDVEEHYANKYFDFMPRDFIITICASILVISLILRSIVETEDSIWLPYAFLVTSVYYTLDFMNTTEGMTNLEGENLRIKEINDGILSISFLAAVNVFIIQSIRESKTSRRSYYEAAILFMVGLSLLLISLYKKTNYNRIDEMREHRVLKQYAYNASVYVNIFILLYYSIYIIGRSNFKNQISASAKALFLRA